MGVNDRSRLRDVVRDAMRYMDRRLIASGVLALIVTALLLGLALFGPANARFGAAVGLIGLLVVAQGLILFFRPVDRSPLGMARSAFVAGDYASAARQLETLLGTSSNNEGNVPALTLLGNTYRQVGRLADSRAQLEEALRRAPNNAFALYGMGRTRLALGEYDAAADLFDRALRAGAPANIACDLGYAEYFAGNQDAALRTLQKTTRLLQLEPYRMFLTGTLLIVLLEARGTNSSTQAVQIALQNMRRTASGRAYWQAEIERQRETPYAQALSAVLVDADRLLAAN